MNIRRYNPEKDFLAIKRIWKEIGWLKDKEYEDELKTYFEVNNAFVCDVNGEPECAVITNDSILQHGKIPLKMSAIMAVSTSLIARRQGFAGKLLAATLADDVNKGAVISGLGMFEQGFYDKLGYGTGNYMTWISFDPATLSIPVKARIPVRITSADWEDVHKGHCKRMKYHGAMDMLTPSFVRLKMLEIDKSFGFGYRDNGELTHYLWISTGDIEHGPYKIEWMVYRNWEQFLELMAIIQSYGDQINLIEMREPPHIQIQDFIKKPMHSWRVTKNSNFETHTNSTAYWQARICDLEKCIEALTLNSDEVDFNLKLSDPIEKYLPADSKWQGCAGDYTIHFGKKSSVKKGFTDGLPTMETGVGAFTRLWFGVRPPSGLAVSDNINAPKNLIEQLDRVLVLPRPFPYLDF